MENTNIIDEEFEDALSFCDLPLFSDQEMESDDYPITSSGDSNSSTELDNFFEFSTTSSTSLLSHSNSASNSIIFCGKSIRPYKSQVAPPPPDNKKTAINSSSLPQRPKNLRSCPSLSSGNYNNGSCRKQKVMIGLAKIPAKMELSDLRERYNNNRKINIPPPPPAPVKGGRELTVVSGKKRRSWALLRPFKCGAQDIASTMARSSSFSCLRLARPWL